MLFTLPAAQVLVKTVGFVAAKISTCQTYQLFFPYISWDKYHHTPIIVMVEGSVTKPNDRLNLKFEFKFPKFQVNFSKF